MNESDLNFLDGREARWRFTGIIFKPLPSMHPFASDKKYGDVSRSFYRGKPSYLTLTDQDEFTRSTIVTGGDPASGLGDFADVWLIVTNPKNLIGSTHPGYGSSWSAIRKIGAYKIGNVLDFKKEIGDWTSPQSSKAIRNENYRYDQFFEYNGKIFFHSPATKNIIEFRNG